VLDLTAYGVHLLELVQAGVQRIIVDRHVIAEDVLGDLLDIVAVPVLIREHGQDNDLGVCHIAFSPMWTFSGQARVVVTYFILDFEKSSRYSRVLYIFT